MGNKRAAVCSGLLVLMMIVVGCGSSTKTRATPTAKLRGVPVSKLECPPHPTTPARTVPSIVGVQAFLLCPTNLPGTPSKAVTVTDRSPEFATLLAALSARDATPTTGVCAAYADLAQVVLASTAHAVYQVSIPVDSCHHYQQRVLKALSQARGN
jgi:hypothetical protein